MRFAIAHRIARALLLDYFHEESVVSTTESLIVAGKSHDPIPVGEGRFGRIGVAHQVSAGGVQSNPEGVVFATAAHLAAELVVVGRHGIVGYQFYLADHRVADVHAGAVVGQVWAVHHGEGRLSRNRMGR